jgi:hypothetical protein
MEISLHSEWGPQPDQRSASGQKLIYGYDRLAQCGHSGVVHGPSALPALIVADADTVDCAETKTGSLLIFEADNSAVVHNMDSPEVFPYKPPQMRKIFDASGCWNAAPGPVGSAA